MGAPIRTVIDLTQPTSNTVRLQALGALSTSLVHITIAAGEATAGAILTASTGGKSRIAKPKPSAPVGDSFKTIYSDPRY